MWRVLNRLATFIQMFWPCDLPIYCFEAEDGSELR